MKLSGDNTIPTDFWCSVYVPESNGNYVYPECSNSSEDNSSNSNSFSVQSIIVSPNNPSATSDNITFTLSFNEAVTDIIAPWRTSSSANTTECSNQAIQFYKNTDQEICAQWQLNDPIYTNDNKTIQITALSSTFSSSGEYTLKITDNTLDNYDFTKKAEAYSKIVTLNP